MWLKVTLGLPLIPRTDDEKVFVAAMAGVPITTKMEGGNLAFITPPCVFYEVNGQCHMAYKEDF